MVVIPIGKSKSGVNWSKIRAEYVKGGISQRKLAEKHGVSINTLIKKANVEKWSTQRDETYNKITKKVQQKTANVVADNATIAAGIKRKLLEKLSRIVDAYQEEDATEIQKVSRSERRVYKLKDLTSMYKDLTDDMPQAGSEGSELLKSLLDLEKRSGRD